ncbi:WD40/YVTN/BNR-like repeat-containing protein [Parendozoicomonas haliclonae]|uniref:Ycf48-like protein n=1 Tax=Parendozoicomonas haliclonae TaxID=1960125 RepID=A0A1X7AMK1_9GAMM|nr:YCF48-related protein [Parendozoicomonas haliclonae]SMA49264.1 Ycf48-like protein precursor [Parendozoicomonas haliclonae]
MKSPSKFLVASLLSSAVIASTGMLSAQAVAEPVSDQILSSLMLDVDKAGTSNHLVAVGDRGHVLWSEDEGKAWQLGENSTQVLLTAVDFPTVNIGYAVGHDAVVLKSTDGGRSWNKVYEDKEAEVPLLDVLFTDANNGFVMGGYGYLLQTTDGGKTWHNRFDSVENFDEFHYNGMTQLKNGMLMMVGEAGTMYRSSDNGKSWETLESPYEGTFFGVSALEQLNGAVAYGLRGNAFITNDSGDTWTELDTGTEQTFFSGLVLKGNMPLLVGTGGTFSRNDGDDVLVNNQSDRAVLTGIVKTSDNVFVVTGENGIRRVDPSVIGL